MSTVYHRPADPSGDDSYVRPLFADRCQAAFPSPATDYAEQGTGSEQLLHQQTCSHLLSARQR